MDSDLAVYCPKCGEFTTHLQTDIISPGDIEIRCPDCNTTWKIQIEFHEDETENK